MKNITINDISLDLLLEYLSDLDAKKTNLNAESLTDVKFTIYNYRVTYRKATKTINCNILSLHPFYKNDSVNNKNNDILYEDLYRKLPKENTAPFEKFKSDNERLDKNATTITNQKCYGIDSPSPYQYIYHKIENNEHFQYVKLEGEENIVDMRTNEVIESGIILQGEVVKRGTEVLGKFITMPEYKKHIYYMDIKNDITDGLLYEVGDEFTPEPKKATLLERHIQTLRELKSKPPIDGNSPIFIEDDGIETSLKLFQDVEKMVVDERVDPSTVTEDLEEIHIPTSVKSNKTIRRLEKTLLIFNNLPKLYLYENPLIEQDNEKNVKMGYYIKPDYIDNSEAIKMVEVFPNKFIIPLLNYTGEIEYDFSNTYSSTYFQDTTDARRFHKTISDNVPRNYIRNRFLELYLIADPSGNFYEADIDNKRIRSSFLGKDHFITINGQDFKVYKENVMGTYVFFIKLPIIFESNTNPKKLLLSIRQVNNYVIANKVDPKSFENEIRIDLDKFFSEIPKDKNKEDSYTVVKYYRDIISPSRVIKRTFTYKRKINTSCLDVLKKPGTELINANYDGFLKDMKNYIYLANKDRGNFLNDLNYIKRDKDVFLSMIGEFLNKNKDPFLIINNSIGSIDSLIKMRTYVDGLNEFLIADTRLDSNTYVEPQYETSDLLRPVFLEKIELHKENVVNFFPDSAGGLKEFDKTSTLERIKDYERFSNNKERKDLYSYNIGLTKLFSQTSNPILITNDEPNPLPQSNIKQNSFSDLKPFIIDRIVDFVLSPEKDSNLIIQDYNEFIVPKFRAINEWKISEPVNHYVTEKISIDPENPNDYSKFLSGGFFKEGWRVIDDEQ